MITSIPGFPRPVPSPPAKRHRIGPSKHGMGAFAVCDMELGDLILAERPLLVMPTTLKKPPLRDGLNYANLPPHQVMKMVLLEYEGLLGQCVQNMLPENKKTFFRLCNSLKAEDGYGQVLGRMRTNGFVITVEKDCDHAATFNEASRFNHSCTPNVTYHFDVPSFSIRLYAIRPIKSGEELFVAYTKHNLSTRQRQAFLRSYGFTCACSACSDRNWDTRLKCIESSLDAGSTVKGSPDKVYKQTLRWIKVIEDANLPSLTVYSKHVRRAEILATMLGKWEEAGKYRALLDKLHFVEYGRLTDT
ncbi:hypothetical protein H0H93_000668 [Arthromyces matolae]|nr:hypothetical protein H0H93_000668 [Arthromyces matolae]